MQRGFMKSIREKCRKYSYKAARKFLGSSSWILIKHHETALETICGIHRTQAKIFQESSWEIHKKQVKYFSIGHPQIAHVGNSHKGFKKKMKKKWRNLPLQEVSCCFLFVCVFFVVFFFCHSIFLPRLRN